MWQEQVRQIALGIRRRVFEHTIKHQGGYLSQACSAAELLAVLYGRLLKLGPSIAPPIPRPFAGAPSAANPHSFTGAGYHGEKGSGLDRFFISPAHYALVVYAALIETGRMDPRGLELFNQDGGSVEMIGAEHSPGMEVTTGSLGQGLSQAVGVALARRLRGDSGRVWVLLSDGELQEGQTWEAFQVLRHYRLTHTAVMIDMNAQQCDGAMTAVLDPGDAAAKLRAFGAQVIEVDGHDIDALAQAGETLPLDGPLVILAYTNPWQGMDYLRKRHPKLHYVRCASEQETVELAAAIAGQLYPQPAP